MDETELTRRLELLRMEHRDLDAAIAALSETGSSDVLQIARLKKRKLRLKDEISQVQDWLVPDIIA
ncbi:YdcH family protein [Sphingomonas sp. CJ99]